MTNPSTDERLIIHVTEKLRKKLHIPELGPADLSGESFYRWYANSFTAQREKFILTTHVESLYSVVMHAEDINDGGLYLEKLLQNMRTALGTLAADDAFERMVGSKSVQVSLVKTFSKSMLQSMNREVDPGFWTVR